MAKKWYVIAERRRFVSASGSVRWEQSIVLDDSGCLEWFPNWFIARTRADLIQRIHKNDIRFGQSGPPAYFVLDRSGPVAAALIKKVYARKI